MGEEGEKARNDSAQLPPLLVAVIAGVLTGLFVINVIADIFVKGYNGYATTSLLGLLIGSLLGVGRYFGFRR